MFCRIFWKLRRYLISKIENHVFEPFLEGRALRHSWHSRSHDAVIRDYDEPGNMIDTHKHFAATAPENRFVESFS